MTKAEGDKNRRAAIQNTTDRTVLIEFSRWREVWVVGQSDAATAEIVDDYSGEIAVVGVHHHPARSGIRSAGLDRTHQGQVTQGSTQVR